MVSEPDTPTVAQLRHRCDQLEYALRVKVPADAWWRWIHRAYLRALAELAAYEADATTRHDERLHERWQRLDAEVKAIR